MDNIIDACATAFGVLLVVAGILSYLWLFATVQSMSCKLDAVIKAYNEWAEKRNEKGEK